MGDVSLGSGLIASDLGDVSLGSGLIASDLGEGFLRSGFLALDSVGVFLRSGFLALDSGEDFPSSVWAGITDLLVFKERDLSFLLLCFFLDLFSYLTYLVYFCSFLQ